METKKVKTMKEAAVAKTTKKELVDELSAKERQLSEDKVRLDSGFSMVLNKPVLSISVEIKRYEREVRMLELEMQFDAPENPRFHYERTDAYRKEVKDKKQEECDGFEKIVETLKEHKAEIEKEIPELESRIEVLKKEIADKPEDKPVEQVKIEGETSSG